MGPSATSSGGSAMGLGGEANGEGGSPYPEWNAISVVCGDRVVGDTEHGAEECDDGDEGSDACTGACQTRDQPILPLSSGAPNARRGHYLGVGRHPIAAGNDGFIVAFTDTTLELPRVSASLYNRFGQRRETGSLSAGSNPLVEANPVAAALPGGAYAVAWTDFDGDGSDLGVALRRLGADGTLSALTFANATREFSQRDADLMWDGSQLVAAWVDFADAERGPDLRYRTFDATLTPTSGDLSLAATELPESNVALAAVQGGWCAAYREGQADGTEYVVVKCGDQTTRVGPLLAGPITDRPALTELDAGHVLLVWSEAIPSAEGPANSFRLAYALVDRSKSETLAGQVLTPTAPVWIRESVTSQVSPATAAAADGVYVAWRSEAIPGDAAADQAWLKYLGWRPTETSEARRLQPTDPEMLLPRTCEGSVGDQRGPALARTALPPDGGLAAAWEDFGRTQGDDSAQPEVVVHFAPSGRRSAASAEPEYFEEQFNGANGSGWGNSWTSQLTGLLTVTTQRQAGQIAASGGTQAIVQVNARAALDADMVTDVRLGPATRAGLFTRRTDADPATYLAFRLSSLRDEPWRIYAMVDGVQTDVVALPPPNNVPVQSTDLAYRVRFRTDTQPNGDLFLGARVWPMSATEPATWTLSKTLPATSPVASRLALPGRFGVLVRPNPNRRVTFDNLLVKYFNGNGQGDFDQTSPQVPLPLKRASATYRRCTPEQPCEIAGGCCDSSADCAEGAACALQPSINAPLGSHAAACVSDHCTNLVRDEDEERPDCGGAHCAPCACTVTASNGVPEFCPVGCPCGIGDAACTQDSQCVNGLICTTGSGPKYGWNAGVGACTPAGCANAALDFGETWPDCGGRCGGCNVVEVTPSNGTINAASAMLQKVVVSTPTLLNAVTGLVEGQHLCLVTQSAQVTLGALAFNRVRDYVLTPNQPACFVVDANLVLQSTNLPAETITALSDVANLDWHLTNEASQFQLSGTEITRWLASVGGPSHDAAQTAPTLRPTYAGGGALLAGTRYLIGEGVTSDWTFLHRPGALFMVFRPDPSPTNSPGYLLGTVHDSLASAGSGFGIYVDVQPDAPIPRLRFRIANGTSDWAFSLTTPRSFPLGLKTVLAATLSDTRLEAFRVHDSLGITTGGALSTSAPYSVALVGAKASTSKNPFAGAIFEIAHYAGPISQRARQAIAQFLADKHGITANP